MKYNNKTTTCYKEDARAITKLKKHFKCKSSNQVIRQLIFEYLNSGKITEEEKIKTLGARLYAMYNY